MLGSRKGRCAELFVEMKRHFRILVGAAVGLTFTPAPLPAFSQNAQPLAAPIVLAQAEGLSPEEEELLRKKRKGGRTQAGAPGAEKPARRERAERQAPAEEQVQRRKQRETANRAPPNPTRRQSPSSA